MSEHQEGGGAESPEEAVAGDAVASPSSDDLTPARPEGGATAEPPVVEPPVVEPPVVEPFPPSAAPPSHMTPQSDWTPSAGDAPGLASLFPADRPERAVGAAFAGGLFLALILRRLAR
ncbi:MAG: hypothetical protein ACLPZR_20315 [Solirubrobacteraceae bacterium]